jgi:hypothetical protein
MVRLAFRVGRVLLEASVLKVFLEAALRVFKDIKDTEQLDTLDTREYKVCLERLRLLEIRDRLVHRVSLV